MIFSISCHTWLVRPRYQGSGAAHSCHFPLKKYELTATPKTLNPGIFQLPITGKPQFGLRLGENDPLFDRKLLEYLPSQGVKKCQTTLESGQITMPGIWSIPGSIWAPIAFFRIQNPISHRASVNIFKKYRLKRSISKTGRFKPNKICKKKWAFTGSVILA